MKLKHFRVYARENLIFDECNYNSQINEIHRNLNLTDKTEGLHTAAMRLEDALAEYQYHLQQLSL